MSTIPDSYEQSRARFRARLASLTTRWLASRLTRISHPQESDLTIDILAADPLVRRDKLIVLSTGLHGIEGYLGSALLELFFDEYLAQLDPKNTGLLLIHAINPWGMKHWKRTNPANVDLNRNFINGDFAALQSFNSDYFALSSFFNPRCPPAGLALANIRFASQTIHKLITLGARRVREAALMGQYQQPDGIYFGGKEIQPETSAMMNLYRQAFPGYAEIVHLDMHSGYGPRDQMTLVTSPHEKMSAKQISARFGIPRVAMANPEEFYTMQGDMTDWEYQLIAKEFPDVKFFGAACEFGTFGESIVQGARSLRITILKNQVNLYGASPQTGDWVEREYRELYLPSEPDWLEKALIDARRAFSALVAPASTL